LVVEEEHASEAVVVRGEANADEQQRKQRLPENFSPAPLGNAEFR
jgi:hypothetical protein